MNTLELNFKKVMGLYQAEFKVEADFNIHVERSESGYMGLYQKTVEYSEYDTIHNTVISPSDLVIDIDVQGFIAPKWICIKSKTRPTFAAITSEGEITQVN